MKWMNAIAGSAVVVMVLAGCGGNGAGAPDSGAGETAGGGSSAPVAAPGTKPGDKPSSPGGTPDESVSHPAGKPGAGAPGADRPNASRPPEGGKAVPAKQIKPDGLPKDHPKKAVVKGTTLAIAAQEGGCAVASAELGKQTAAQVEVTVVLTEPKEPRMCTMDIRFPWLTVELDEPLGDRTVVLKYDKRKA